VKGIVGRSPVTEGHILPGDVLVKGKKLRFRSGVRHKSSENSTWAVTILAIFLLLIRISFNVIFFESILGNLCALTRENPP